jgi:hypothetical protein
VLPPTFPSKLEASISILLFLLFLYVLISLPSLLSQTDFSQGSGTARPSLGLYKSKTDKFNSIIHHEVPEE